MSPTGRDDGVDADPVGDVVDVLDAAPAFSDELGDDPEVGVGHVDGHAIKGLEDMAVLVLPGEYPRLADRQLETLSTHRLDEHRELQFAATLHLPGVRTLGHEHPDRDVADDLLIEPVLDEAGRHLRAFPSGQWRGVDAERHRQAGLIDVDHRQRDRIGDIGERFADEDLGDAGDGNDLAGAGGVGQAPGPTPRS